MMRICLHQIGCVIVATLYSGQSASPRKQANAFSYDFEIQV